MRADRLVALLLLLQRRGRVTAGEVAEELEVSERTARRDLEALSMAGVPVYSQQGRNGGWQLLGGGRTDLSGLTADEARALFLVAGPASATPEVRAALRKLVRALPETLRDEAEAASSAVVIDQGWGRSSRRTQPPAHLGVLQRAVVEGVQLQLSYVARDGNVSERVVHPLGLAARGSVWYLLAETAAGMRTFRVERVAGAEPTGEPVVRPDGFDLEEAWSSASEGMRRHWRSVEVTAIARGEGIELLQKVFGTRLSIGPPDNDGRVGIVLAGPSEAAVVGELSGFGALVEITGPSSARARAEQIAAELAEIYLTPLPR
jgi:predicted DNA-binding transcriptional regulator YafY